MRARERRGPIGGQIKGSQVLRAMYEELKETTISREDVFTGKIFTVHVDQVRLPNGKTAVREVADHCPCVAVVALDDENNVLTVTQYRYVFGRALLEIPAGKLEPGEDPAAGALRELREETGATPDGRYAHTPVADGVSPSAGKDVKGPTAAATSVSRLDHFIVSNGTLFNQKFHPSALSGREGLEKFVALIRSYFDQKGMHMQFNVVDRATLLDAQEHPEKYKHLVVRVAGYSALFTTLSRSLQDDIIRRTEQGF